MTNSQAANHDSWLVRCSHRNLGFSQSNQHNYIQGLEEYWEGGGEGGGLKIFLKGGGGIKEGGLFEKGGDKYPFQTM